MRLTADQEAMLAGGRGWPFQFALEMLVAVGKVHDAADLIPVSSVHLVIDAFAMDEPGTELVERLHRAGGRFVVPTTINAISYDRRAVAEDGEMSGTDRCQQRMLQACQMMGGLATCSCNPFSQGVAPIHGEAVAWSESAAAPFVNSVIGARTNREGASALASALTGLTPRYGMHLPEERRGGMVISVETAVRGLDEFNLLGAAVARLCDGRIPVLTGLRRRPTADELFGFGASLAIVSSVPMFQMVGITPEAATLEAAFPNGAPAPVVLERRDIEAERSRLSTAMTDKVEVVSIGAPHATIAQVQEVARLLGSRRVHRSVEFLLTTSRSTFAVIEAAGLLRELAAAGVTITADKMCFGCDLGGRKFGGSGTVATNSVKLAHLAPGSRDIQVLFGSAAQCVEAAVTGRWTTA